MDLLTDKRLSPFEREALIELRLIKDRLEQITEQKNALSPEEAKGLNENNAVLAVDSDRLAEIVLEKLKPKIDEIILESMLNSMRIQEHIREAEESWED